ncbi:YheC/YheD family protein [Paenibacillus arenosi]|uniref:YheC/YheD family protein n=1 Tax=Paenibacillus arenosi TaxID=2774142 RepID=A0ABR9B3Q8_9BACL|nr:YheC/YheD family protein [Paenibacillus arenosi]MBD8501001.1 YheC/YheD family protein [Paenibacillus arenosi]
MRIRRVRSKLKKAAAIDKHAGLKIFQPETTSFSSEHLYQMLYKHSMLYIKPEGGTGGAGIIRVGLTNHSTSYLLQKDTFSERWDQFDQLYARLSHFIGSKKYLIQQGIHLLTNNKRPLDLRIMVQRNKGDAWEMTGMLARVAAPRKVVTNYHRGGTLHQVDSVLRQYADSNRLQELKKQLEQIALLTAKHLNKHFPTLIELGIDIGLDKQLKPWILEVNTQPDKNIFRFHTNKKLYSKMMGYVRYQILKRTLKKTQANPAPQLLSKTKPKPFAAKEAARVRPALSPAPPVPIPLLISKD